LTSLRCSGTTVDGSTGLPATNGKHDSAGQRRDQAEADRVQYGRGFRHVDDTDDTDD